MIVTAALVWWDEPPELLEACVRGAAQIADRFVALDGAYRRYPGATITSPPKQARVIRETAAKLGLECLVLTPDRLWAGQVEKRTHLYNIAALGSDWFVTVDADHIIHADRAAARAELASYGPDVDVVNVPFFTPPHPRKSIDATASTNWHRWQASVRMDIGQIFRSLPGLRVEQYHYWISALKAGQRVWLAASTGHAVVPPRRMNAPYEVEHVSLIRDERHMLANRAFCNDRVMVVAKTDQEDDVPGLPAPTWDYVTVPY